MYLLFYRKDSTDFSDICKDKNLKKYILCQQCWHEHMLLRFDDQKDKNWDKILSYIMLKYSDELKNLTDVIKDFSPVPFVDYYPEKILVNGKYIKR